MKGITWALACVVTLVAWASGIPLGRAISGSLFLTLGYFCADQATHLRQHNHTIIPTLIERSQYRYPALSVVIGLILVIVGMKILLT